MQRPSKFSDGCKVEVHTGLLVQAEVVVILEAAVTVVDGRCGGRRGASEQGDVRE